MTNKLTDGHTNIQTNRQRNGHTHTSTHLCKCDYDFKDTFDRYTPVGWDGLILFKHPLDGVEFVDGGVGGVVVDVQVVLGAVVVGVGHHQVDVLPDSEELPVCRSVRLHVGQR